MITPKYTKTLTFLFPLLKIPKALFYCDVKNIFDKQMFNNRFINAYLIDEVIKKYSYKEGYITVHINNYRDVNFESFYDTLCSFPTYVEDYEIHDCLFFVFKVPDHLFEDFQILLQEGAGYSQISPDAKKLILSNHFFSAGSATIPLILNRSLVLKESWNERLDTDIGDQEVWGMITLPKETLTKKIITTFSKSKQKLNDSITYEK